MQIDVEGGDADQESFKEKGQETNVALNELRGGQHKNKDHNQNDFEKQIALYLDLRHREERLMAEWKTWNKVGCLWGRKEKDPSDAANKVQAVGVSLDICF